jgi:hypothetical protein
MLYVRNIWRGLLVVSLALVLQAQAVQKRQKISAGILPYAYDTTGQPFFLLGQEPNGEWADFGGRADRADRNSKMTAIREFSEETRCVFGAHVGQKSGRKRPVSYPICMKASSRYIASKMGRPLLHPRGYYAMYLARVSYISETIFNNAAKIPHYEKIQYAWVPALKFIEAVAKSGQRDATWFGHKKIRPPFVDMIKSYAYEIKKVVVSR